MFLGYINFTFFPPLETCLPAGGLVRAGEVNGRFRKRSPVFVNRPAAGPPVTDGWDRWPCHWWAERRNQLVNDYGLTKGLWYSPDEERDIDDMWREDEDGTSRVFGGYFYFPRDRGICLWYKGDSDVWPVGILRDVQPDDNGEMIVDTSAVPLLTDRTYFSCADGQWNVMHPDPSTPEPEMIHSLWLDGHVASPAYHEIENHNYAWRFGGIFCW